MVVVVVDFFALLLVVFVFLRIFCYTESREVFRNFAASLQKLFQSHSEYPDSKMFEIGVGSTVSDTTVLEPFKKLEKDSKSRDVWFIEQNEIYIAYMEQLVYTRQQLLSKIGKFQKCEAFETPFHVNNSHYFYSKKYRRDQRHFILFSTGNVRHKGTVLLDPNFEFDQQLSVIMLGTWVSDDTRNLCYAFSKTVNHQNYIQIRVKDIEIIKDSVIDDISLHLEDGNYFSLSVSWMHRSRGGFFYNRLNFPGEQVICFHRIGTPQDRDIIVYHCEADKNTFNGSLLYPASPSVTVTPDDCYLFIEIFEECNTPVHTHMGNKVVLLDISRFNCMDTSSLGMTTPIVDSYTHRYCSLSYLYLSLTCRRTPHTHTHISMSPLIPFFHFAHTLAFQPTNRWEYLANKGEEFWFRTNCGAAKFRIVRSKVSVSHTPHHKIQKECKSDDRMADLEQEGIDSSG